MSKEFNPGLTFLQTRYYKKITRSIKMGFQRNRTAVGTAPAVMCKYKIIIAVCLKFKQMGQPKFITHEISFNI